MTGFGNSLLTNPEICVFAGDCDTGGYREMQHTEAVQGVSSVPVCRRVVHTRKISSPKLDSQFLQ